MVGQPIPARRLLSVLLFGALSLAGFESTRAQVAPQRPTLGFELEPDSPAPRVSEPIVGRIGNPDSEPAGLPIQTTGVAQYVDQAGEPCCWMHESRDPFAAGTRSLQFLTGYYASTGIGPIGPQFEHVPIAVRLGWMLNSPCEDRWLRGNFEAIVELFAAPVAVGPGNITVGPSLMLRYNFVRPATCVVPYVQVGAGVVYNDGYKDWTQDLFGQAQEFLLQAQAGCRFVVSENWSLDIEGGWHHISNAGQAARNGGANVFGGSVGVTYFFRKP